MKPDDDPLFQLLQALPREDLATSRSERLRRRAHAELRQTTMSTRSYERWLEPLLFATCAGCVLARLAAAVVWMLRASG